MGGKLTPHSKARKAKAPKVKQNSGAAAQPSASSSNDAALLLKLKELTGGIDPEASDSNWIESLVVTSAEPLQIEDANDDLKRELALCARRLPRSNPKAPSKPLRCVFISALTSPPPPDSAFTATIRPSARYASPRSVSIA